MTRFIISLLLVGALSACGGLQDTNHTLSVRYERTEAYTTPDGRECLRNMLGNKIVDGSCTDPTLLYDEIRSVQKLKNARRFSDLPCTEYELWFLTADICNAS